MAERVIEVVVAFDQEAVLAGRLFSHRGQGRESATFAYESSYLARPEAYALEPGLPLVQGALHTPVDLPMFRSFAQKSAASSGKNISEFGQNISEHHFSFAVTAGNNYQIQWKTNLSQPEWINLSGPIKAASDTLDFSDTNTAAFPQKFYRLKWVP